MFKDLLISFLNDLLDGERTIKEIQFLNKERLGMSLYERKMIYDISCMSSSGEYFIVEMQNQRQWHFDDRVLYYMSMAMSDQGDVGTKWNFELNAVYGVFL